MTAEEVKQAEQLYAEGGHFYTIGGESYCDTALDTWRLVPGKGYVRVPDIEEEALK